MVEIIKSPADKKLYRHLVLENGLTVLLVSDPDINVVPHAEGTAAGEPAQVGRSGKGSKSSKRAASESDDGDDGSDDDAMEEDDSEGSEDEGESSGGSDEEGSSGSDEGEEEDGSEEDEGEEGEEGSEAGGKRKGSGGIKAPVKKAAAAMAVGVGSFSDPAELQGLSHYLEHMLFMGSAKYPNENEYDDFLTKHGGSSNAFTELEYTNYHFDVSPDALRGALDRFSAFFISPLCNGGSLEREVLAVDSEFHGVQQSDPCRHSQLMCHTAKRGHIYNKFSWGNKKSLWDDPKLAGINVQDEVMKYWKQQYSAERMSLVVVGGEPLDTLQQWVADCFDALPRGRGPRPNFGAAGMPFTGRMMYLIPAVRDAHEVTLTFQLPSLLGQYRKKSEHYISHLVGHEGPGSLLSALKARGWATEVCAGIEEDGYSQNTACYLFTITITLTDAGLAAAALEGGGGAGVGLGPVGLAFQYLEMLRRAGPQEWVWQELKSIAEMKFLFQEEEDTCELATRLSSSLHLHEPRHILMAEYLHEEWDPDMVRSLLDRMQPATSDYRVDLLTRAYEQLKPQLAQGQQQGAAALLLGPEAAAAGGAGGDGAVVIETEPWFGMEAAWMPLPDALVNAWASAAPAAELHLPPVNPYVATDFALKCPPEEEEGEAAQGAVAAAPSAAPAGTGEAAPRKLSRAERETSALAAKLGLPLVLATPPSLVLDESGLRLWHKLDCAFLLPRAHAYFRLHSPSLYDSPRAAALGHAVLKLLEDALAEDAYLADVAGLHYATAPEGMTGYEIKVDGFSHKLPLLTRRIFSTLASASFEQQSFDNVKEALVRKYRNSSMQVPKHASYERLYALCGRSWHFREVQPHVEALQLADVQPFVKQVLSSCHLEVLLHGNITLAEAQELAGAVKQLLGPGCSMGAEERVRDRCVQLEEGTAAVHRASARNPAEENCAVEAYYQVGPASGARDRALIDLVDQMVYEPCFNTLRTAEQLGYTVHSGTRLTHGVLGFCVHIVSAKFPPAHVDKRVETFLAGFGEKLASYSEDEFAKHKASLASSKLSRDRGIADESVRHWDHIWNQRYDFLAREAEVAALEKLTLDDVRAWWGQHLAVTSGSRKKLAVYVSPTRTCAAATPGSPQDTSEDGGAGGVPGASWSVQQVPDLDAFKRARQLFPALLNQPSSQA